MAQYLPTNVNVTNGDATVVVVGVDATLEVGAGDLFGVNGTGIITYEVASASFTGGNTEVELTTPYAGTTQTGITGVFIRDFTTNFSFPYPSRGDLEVAKLLARSITLIDAEIKNSNDALTAAVAAGISGGTF